MKTQYFILTGLMLVATFVYSQKDHRLIGHLDGSDIWEQNINNYHEYTIFTGSVNNNASESVLKVTGKTTFTSYKYNGDNSTFGIANKYLDFLKQNGFEIIFSCKNEECGKKIAETYSQLNKLETTDNSLEPAFSNQDYFRNYISAKKQIENKTIYICIFISQGWWNFPVYRIDVVEEKKNTAIIVNNNTDNTSTDNEDKKLNNKKTNKEFSYSAQMGISSYNFFDNQLYGEDYVTKTGQNATNGNLSGYRNLFGGYFKAIFFINKNLGIGLDLAIHSVEHNNFVGDSTSTTEYKTTSDLTFQRIGIIGRFAGKDYPIKLQLSTGIGHGNFSAYYMIKQTIGNNTYQENYEGTAGFPIVFFQTELQIPIFKGLFFFSEFEYTIAWAEEFIITHGSGNDYREIKQKEPNFGGLNYRAGLGYEF